MQNEPYMGFQPKRKFPLVSVLLGLFLLISLVFGLWAFSAMLDYKDNSDKKSDLAVSKALTEQKSKLDAAYEEKAKSPYDTYQASSEFGSLRFEYPKSWSLYVDSKISGGSSSIDGYAHPSFVPGVGSETSFALRFQVVDNQYAEELKSYDASLQNSGTTVSPYRSEKVQQVLGSKISGKITPNKSGVMFLLPLRDKTIKIWTESNTYAVELDKLMSTLSYLP